MTTSDWTGNSKAIYSCHGASNHSDTEREANDYYATPPSAVEMLLGLEGFSEIIMEPACGEGDELLDKYALDRQYDVVFASNVINVQSSMEMLRETLTQIYKATKYGGEFICNYPSSPRKMDMTTNDIARVIKEVFGNVENIGGTKSAPILKMRKMAN